MFLCVLRQLFIVRAVEDAHPYLDAHMDTLNDFGLSDSRYCLALCGRVVHIVNLIPTDKLEFNVSHCLPGEEEYMANASHCVAENDLRPFWMHSLPAPHRPQVAASSAKPSADVAVTMPPPRPHPMMIRQPEPAIPPVWTLKVEVRMPHPSLVGSLTACKRQHAPDPTTPPSINLTQVKRSTRLSKTAQPAPPSIDVKATRPMHGTHTSSCKSKSALPTMSTTAVVKKSGSVYISDDMVVSESGGEGGATEVTTPGWDHEAVDDDIVVPPIKHLCVNDPSPTRPPPLRAYHLVMGEPLLGLKYVSISAVSKPIQSLSVVKSAVSSKGKGKVVEQPSAVVSFAPSSSLTTDVVDNTIYSHAFHPSVDLQYHEPRSHQALESMKLSWLPAAPDSLTKPMGQIRSGQEYVYRCHSDQDPYFICPPLLNWPCFNCTLAGCPDQCVFEGGIGKECCTKCKSSCHGRCSARWDANQLRQAATLLDPLTLSGDGAICRGVQRVDRINSEIELLGRAMQSLHEDREVVIREIADGLDAIACHEHGTEIVDAYSQVSSFLKSFIVHLGGAASESSNGDVGAGDD
ncbi:hypothetical protein IW261DRAFT_1660380 [Armillaria novae-zelandiae]|uniref:Uncharacterized protein n=1 Tax=Armillaria novae-zelandiae TaxID=153914 RepID=A0AA39NVV9_9AGAR|nr:hypothetical protein IW261DRAFT_1660380 [Armillaria novae-zelandiae]